MDYSCGKELEVLSVIELFCFGNYLEFISSFFELRLDYTGADMADMC